MRLYSDNEVTLLQGAGESPDYVGPACTPEEDAGFDELTQQGLVVLIVIEDDEFWQLTPLGREALRIALLVRA